MSEKERKLPGGVRYVPTPPQKTELGLPGEDQSQLTAAEAEPGVKLGDLGPVVGEQIFVADRARELGRVRVDRELCHVDVAGPQARGPGDALEPLLGARVLSLIHI